MENEGDENLGRASGGPQAVFVCWDERVAVVYERWVGVCDFILFGSNGTMFGDLRSEIEEYSDFSSCPVVGVSRGLTLRGTPTLRDSTGLIEEV